MKISGYAKFGFIIFTSLLSIHSQGQNTIQAYSDASIEIIVHRVPVNLLGSSLNPIEVKNKSIGKIKSVTVELTCDCDKGGSVTTRKLFNDIKGYDSGREALSFVDCKGVVTKCSGQVISIKGDDTDLSSSPSSSRSTNTNFSNSYSVPSQYDNQSIDNTAVVRRQQIEEQRKKEAERLAQQQKIRNQYKQSNEDNQHYISNQKRLEEERYRESVRRNSAFQQQLQRETQQTQSNLNSSVDALTNSLLALAEQKRQREEAASIRAQQEKAEKKLKREQKEAAEELRLEELRRKTNLRGKFLEDQIINADSKWPTSADYIEGAVFYCYFISKRSSTMLQFTSAIEIRGYDDGSWPYLIDIKDELKSKLPSLKDSKLYLQGYFLDQYSANKSRSSTIEIAKYAYWRVDEIGGAVNFDNQSSEVISGFEDAWGNSTSEEPQEMKSISPFEDDAWGISTADLKPEFPNDRIEKIDNSSFSKVVIETKLINTLSQTWSRFITRLKISPRNEGLPHYLAAEGEEKEGSTLLWDIDNKETIARLEYNGRFNGESAFEEWGVYSMEFSPDGKTIAIGYADGAMIIWNVMDQTKLNTEYYNKNKDDQTSIDDIAFSFDGKLMALFISHYGDNDTDEILILDVKSHQVKTKITNFSSIAGPMNFSRRLNASDDEDYFLFVGFEDGYIRTYNASTGDQIQNIEFNKISELLVDSDNSFMYASSINGNLTRWNLSKDSEILTNTAVSYTGHTKVTSMDIASSGDLLVSGGTDKIIVWNTLTFEKITVIDSPFNDRVICGIDISEDGQFLAAGSAGSKTENVKVWSLERKIIQEK